MPPDSVEVDLGAGLASFRLTISVFDDHDLRSALTNVFPAGFPQAADVTFDVEWSGIVDRQNLRNDAENFDGEFVQTGSTVVWSAHNPSTGFSFESEGPNPGRLFNAAIGHVRNGVFFE